MSGQNRPFKYGANDRREFIVQDSEVTVRLVYDASNNPIYIARAKVGVGVTEAKWQIQQLNYTANNLVSVLWPQSGGIASSEYEFVYNNYLTYTYS